MVTKTKSPSSASPWCIFASANLKVSLSRFGSDLPSWNRWQTSAAGVMHSLLNTYLIVLSGALFIWLLFHIEYWTPYYSCIRHSSGSIVLKLDFDPVSFFRVSNLISLRFQLFWELVFGFGWSSEDSQRQHVFVVTFESFRNGAETYSVDDLPWDSYQSRTALFHSRCNLGQPSSSSSVHLDSCCLVSFESTCY